MYDLFKQQVPDDKKSQFNASDNEDNTDGLPTERRNELKKQAQQEQFVFRDPDQMDANNYMQFKSRQVPKIDYCVEEALIKRQVTKTFKFPSQRKSSKINLIELNSQSTKTK